MRIPKSRRSVTKFNTNLEVRHSSTEEYNFSLKEMAEELTWRNIDMVEIPGKGQGLIAITPFQKKIVVVDYHGEEMVHSKGVSLDHFCAENPDQ